MTQNEPNHTTAGDEAAQKALEKLTWTAICPDGVTIIGNAVEGTRGSSAIVAAIRADKVPGVYLGSEAIKIAGDITKMTANIADMRARLHTESQLRGNAVARAEKAEADIVSAAGELMVSMNEAPPGSTVARLLNANVLMRHARDAAQAEVARLRDAFADAINSAGGIVTKDCELSFLCMGADQVRLHVKKKNDRIAHLVSLLREARRGLAWVTIDNMPEAGGIIQRIDAAIDGVVS